MTPFEQRCAREDEEDRLGRILYLEEFAEARIVRDATPGSRIVRYQRGYAVQLHKSGPYMLDGGNVYRPHGRETLYGTAQYADPFTIDNASNGARR